MTAAGTWRPAVRVVCLDAAGAVLLLHWRDPVSGARLFEPPGGGIEAGETPLSAARRELVEETGLDPDAIEARSVPVARDVMWNGVRYVGRESFFLARFPESRPALAPGGLEPVERHSLLGHRWVPVPDLASVPNLEPPQLPGVLGDLAPGIAEDHSFG